jgi:hypothetical protein
MTNRAYIFGYGDIGNNIIAKHCNEYSILGFLDNNQKLWGRKLENGLVIYPPEKVKEGNFDFVLVASTGGFKEIPEQLVAMGIGRDRIIMDYSIVQTKGRLAFLEKTGELFAEKNIAGSVAEGGVYRGNFSCEINRVFPNKTLYLFDTFTGFDPKDVEIEYQNKFSESKIQNYFGETSEELVIKKLPYPEKVILRKGYFSETAKGLEDTFCFVNLDFDLYQPILAGLDYFYPRMVLGGIIIVHDYFSETYKGVKQAINDFVGNNSWGGGVKLFPIGDGISIGICC